MPKPKPRISLNICLICFVRIMKSHPLIFIVISKYFYWMVPDNIKSWYTKSMRKTCKTKHINPLSQKQSGWQHCFCILYIYIIIFSIKVNFSWEIPDGLLLLSGNNFSLIDVKDSVDWGKPSGLNLHGCVHAMPSDKINLTCSRTRAHLHATSQGMMCKTPLCSISWPFHLKGVKVFVPRTSPHRWCPKTIYTSSVSVQTEVPSSLSSDVDVEHWFMGRFPTRLKGPGWAPTPCLVFWVTHRDLGLNPSYTMTILSHTV